VLSTYCANYEILILNNKLNSEKIKNIVIVFCVSIKYLLNIRYIILQTLNQIIFNKDLNR